MREMRSATVAEDELGEIVRRLENNSVGYQSLQLHVSRLQPRNRTKSVLDFAYALLRKYAHTYNDHLFRLDNDDLVLVCQGKKVQDLFDVITRVRAMVADDPLFETDNQDLSTFATWRDLSIDWAEFMAECQSIRIDSLARRRRREKKDGDAEKDEIVEPLDARRLDQLEHALKVMDASALLRRSPVRHFDESGRSTLVYEELMISIRDVQKRTVPGIDLRANPWLFKQLTRTLDQRMLRHLGTARRTSFEVPFGINLNLSTLTSVDFLQMMERLRTIVDYKPIVEIGVGDMFTNPRDFRLARDARQELDYLICLDDISYVTLPLLTFANLGCDLYKMHWDDGIQTLRSKDQELLKEAAIAAGAASLILTDCDSVEAMAFGRDLGCTMFQGRFVDESEMHMRR